MDFETLASGKYPPSRLAHVLSPHPTWPPQGSAKIEKWFRHCEQWTELTRLKFLVLSGWLAEYLQEAASFVSMPTSGTAPKKGTDRLKRLMRPSRREHRTEVDKSGGFSGKFHAGGRRTALPTLGPGAPAERGCDKINRIASARINSLIRSARALRCTLRNYDGNVDRFLEKARTR